MKVAKNTGDRLSPDPSTKVGAVIFRPGKFISSGANHFPPGTPEEYWADRVLKYPHVVHAEATALLGAGWEARDSVLACSAQPCVACAALIAEAGIRCVICPSQPWRDVPEVVTSCQQGAAIFERAGIEVIHVDLKDDEYVK
ncbi:MAG: hypothetical protein JWN75_1221 [Candidatus Saccharibacteria bacterium]|nr:hypothetical protein [Candidatus Saccharibacteria bacterium]MDB5716418.1 hypothetical protein [Sphingomonadales bacterium]